MDFEVKNQKFLKKSGSKTMFFSISFFYGFWVGLGRILGGFWEGFGGSWRLLAHFWASFFGIRFWCFYLQCSPKGLLEAPGIDFGSILKGLARVLGWVLGRF